MNNFQLLVVLLTGLFSGFFAAIFADPVKKIIFKPKLVLEFGKSEDYNSRTPMKKNNHETEGCYIRIKVINKSKHIAKDCRAYLIDVERKDKNSHFLRTEYCDSIPLGWSCRDENDKKERFRGIYIPRGINQYVDVIATVKDSSVFEPQIMVKPYRYSKLFEKKGIFRFTIQVTAADDNPKTIKLILNWKGVWDDFKIEKV